MVRRQETFEHRTTDVLPEEAEVKPTKKNLASWVPKLPTLPHYTGAFSVGCTDFTWSYLKERQPFEGTEKTITTSKEIRHMVARLYYPAEVTGGEKTAKWLPFPSSVYAQGYGDFKKLPRWLSIPVVVGMLSFTSIHAFVEAKLPKAGPFTNPTKKHQFPVVIFSHGLGGCRTTYSSICGEIASHGFVVCAVEHRDGTANASALPNTGKDVISYRWPPSNDTSAEYNFRRGQLLFRVSEIQQTIQMLKRLNNGENIEEGKVLTASESQFQNRLDFANMIMAGHSFGAATTVETLRTENSFFRCGILLDPWIFALEHETGYWRGGLVPTLDKPVLTINSEGFTQWKESFVMLLSFLNKNPERSRSPFITVKESRHMNQSDFPVLFQTVHGLKDKFSGKIDPEVALRLNNRAILQFMRNSVAEFRQFLPDDEKIFSEETNIIIH